MRNWFGVCRIFIIRSSARQIRLQLSILCPLFKAALISFSIWINQRSVSDTKGVVCSYKTYRELLVFYDLWLIAVLDLCRHSNHCYFGQAAVFSEKSSINSLCAAAQPQRATEETLDRPLPPVRRGVCYWETAPAATEQVQGILFQQCSYESNLHI